MSTKTIVTCAEFERIAESLGPCELLDGEVVRLSPAGFWHSVVTGNIYTALSEFVRGQGLGRVLTNEVGLHLTQDPPRSRGADVLFVSYRRIPKESPPTGFLTVPPELIVEIFGDEASWPEMESKVTDYHQFGVDMVWVADPHTRTVKRFPRSGSPDVVHDGQEIVGESVLPGFRLQIAALFDEP